MAKDIELLHQRRDDLIRNLWLVLRDLSDHHIGTPPREMSDEDLKLWGAVTEHSAVQSRLATKGSSTTDG